MANEPIDTTKPIVITRDLIERAQKNYVSDQRHREKKRKIIKRLGMAIDED